MMSQKRVNKIIYRMVAEISEWRASDFLSALLRQTKRGYSEPYFSIKGFQSHNEHIQATPGQIVQAIYEVCR